MKTIGLEDYSYIKGIINAAKVKIKDGLKGDTDDCNNDDFWKQIEEEELHKCNCGGKCNEDNIMIPYDYLVKADNLLFLVGQHGKAVIDNELQEEMIKTASCLRKVYMNMKGE